MSEVNANIEGVETPQQPPSPEVQGRMDGVNTAIASVSGETGTRLMMLTRGGDLSAAETILREMRRAAVNAVDLAYVESKVNDRDLDVFSDPRKLRADIEKLKALLDQVKVNFEANLSIWNVGPDHQAILEANRDVASEEGLEIFINSLSNEEIAKVGRMQEPTLVLLVEGLPHFDYEDHGVMKPGFITLADQVFESKGLNKIWLHDDTKKYLQNKDNQLKKIEEKLKWSIVEGADLPVRQYSDGSEDDINVEWREREYLSNGEEKEFYIPWDFDSSEEYFNTQWSERLEKAQTQPGPKLGYNGFVSSQLLRAQNGILGQENESSQTTLLDGETLLEIWRVPFAYWNRYENRVRLYLNFIDHEPYQGCFRDIVIKS